MSQAVTSAQKELGSLVQELQSYNRCALEEAVSQVARCALNGLPRCPVMKDSSGLVSLTLISGYIKEGRPHGAVYKWVRQHEVGSLLLYEKVLPPAKGGAISYGFLLPETEVLSIEDPLVADLLKYSKMSSEQDAGPRGAAEAVLAMEKVAGSGMGDFLRENYKELAAKGLHAKLFLRLGRMALFDLLMGNTDRLLRPVNEGKGYVLDGVGSSLGNIMVRYSEDKFVLYLIDNEIDPGLDHKAYCAFLKQQNPEGLAKHIQEALIGGIADYQEVFMGRPSKEERREALAQCRETFSQFHNDLSRIGNEQITLGIRQMISFIPKMIAQLNPGSGKAAEQQLIERLKSFPTTEAV